MVLADDFGNFAAVDVRVAVLLDDGQFHVADSSLIFCKAKKPSVPRMPAECGRRRNFRRKERGENGT